MQTHRSCGLLRAYGPGTRVVRGVCCARRPLAPPRLQPAVPVHAAAAASAAAPASQPSSWWQQVLHWWDVGQAESEKSRQPQKISETLRMAGSLVSNEKRLISAAVVLMVSRSGWFEFSFVCILLCLACRSMVRQHTGWIVPWSGVWPAADADVFSCWCHLFESQRTCEHVAVGFKYAASHAAPSVHAKFTVVLQLILLICSNASSTVCVITIFSSCRAGVCGHC